MRGGNRTAWGIFGHASGRSLAHVAFLTHHPDPGSLFDCPGPRIMGSPGSPLCVALRLAVAAGAREVAGAGG